MGNINSRKTIRKYTQKDISDTLLKQLLDEAEHTPTMGNLQLYSVIITRNADMKAQLAPAHFSQPMVEGAPVVLTFCADFRRTTLWAINRKATPGYDNFLSFLLMLKLYYPFSSTYSLWLLFHHHFLLYVLFSCFLYILCHILILLFL